VALVAFRVHRARLETPRVVHRITAPPGVSQVPSQPRPAIERPQEIRLHLHGVSAEDVAAILARDHLPGGPS
jgi:hypothetical protein